MLQRDLRKFSERPRRGRRLIRNLLALVAIASVGAAALLFFQPRDGAISPSGVVPESTASGEESGDAQWIRIPLRIPPPRASRSSQDGTTGTQQAGTWREHTIQAGDTLAKIFAQFDISAQILHRVVRSGKDAKRLARIVPGQRLRLRVHSDGGLQELCHEIDALTELRVTRTPDGFASTLVEHEVERRVAHASTTINASLFLAAQRAGLPDNVTMELAEIFGWDIDFALSIRTGDQFTVLYEELYLDGDLIGNGDILAAEFVNQGKSYRAVRFELPEDRVEYYTAEGNSMRKSFLRTPVKFSRISSRFNLQRKHPVLNRIRAHRGVDYAAASGTPVRATGDGRISFRGRKGGYGRTVMISHANGYSTLYAHMSRYAKGASKGRQVRQGDIIGYVGKSGLATGPHLHYEFRVRGKHRDPLKVKLPNSTPLPARHHEQFETQAQPLLAKLEIVKSVLLAAR